MKTLRLAAFAGFAAFALAAGPPALAKDHPKTAHERTGSTAASAAAPAMSVQARYPGPDGGWDFTTFDPVRRRLFVSRSNGITALDVDTGKVTAQLVEGKRTHIAVPINDGAEILVTDGGSAGAFIANAVTGARRGAAIPTGTKPDGAFLEPSTGMAWVLDNGGGGVAIIDPKAGALVGRIEVPGALESPATDGSGVVFITVEDKAEIVAFDAAKRTILRHIPLAGCEDPTGLALDPNAKRLVAVCANGVAKIVDAASGNIVGSVAIGPRPDTAFFDPARKLVFAPTGGDAQITMIDAATARVVGHAPSNDGARSGAIDPKTGRIYLPSGKFTPAAAGGRPQLQPGSFEIIAVGDK